MKKIISILLCVLLLLGSVFTLASCNTDDDSDVDVNAQDYADALAFLECGNYEDAQALFEKLGDYKDSAEYLSRFYYMPTSFEYDLIGKNGTNEITYNDNNLPATETVEREDARGLIEFIYDSDGNIITQRVTNNGYVSAYAYTYNSQGKRIGAVYSDQDENSASYVFEYDDNGNLIKQTYLGTDGITYEYYFGYDANGNMITQEGIFEGISQYTLAIVYTYDDNGRVISEVGTYSDDTQESYEYTYDAKGNCIKEIFTDYDGFEYCYDFTYDDNGNMVEEVCTYLDGTVQYVKIVYELMYIPCGITEGTDLFFNEFWASRL